MGTSGVEFFIASFVRMHMRRGSMIIYRRMEGETEHIQIDTQPRACRYTAKCGYNARYAQGYRNRCTCIYSHVHIGTRPLL
jgi:hypothetical protein